MCQNSKLNMIKLSRHSLRVFFACGSALLIGCTEVASTFSHAMNDIYSDKKYSRFNPRIFSNSDFEKYWEIVQDNLDKEVKDELGSYIFHVEGKKYFSKWCVENAIYESIDIVKTTLRDNIGLLEPIYVIQYDGDKLDILPDWEVTRKIYNILNVSLKLEPFEMTKRYDKRYRKYLTGRIVEYDNNYLESLYKNGAENLGGASR